MAWAYEEQFNSDTKSTGDLNGQDGWSGDTDFDVVTTSPFEGDQHITCTNGNGSIVDTFTAVSTGTFYVSIRKLNNTSDCGFQTKNSSGTILVVISFRPGSGTDDIRVYNNLTLTEIVPASFSKDVYYTFEIIINGDDTFDIRAHDTTSWLTQYTGFVYYNSGSGDTAQVALSSGGPGGGSHTEYFDDITATNPYAVEEEAGPTTRKRHVYWW